MKFPAEFEALLRPLKVNTTTIRDPSNVQSTCSTDVRSICLTS